MCSNRVVNAIAEAYVHGGSFKGRGGRVEDCGCNVERVRGPIRTGEDFSPIIALQDVTPASGPTVLLPRSHSDAAVAADPALRDAEARYLAARQRAIDSVGEVDMRLLADAEHAARRFRTFNRAPLLRRGDALIYDSRLRHCGSANVSAAPRRLFNFGFAAAGAAEVGHLRGHTATLSAELYGACSLDEDPATCWPHGAS